MLIESGPCKKIIRKGNDVDLLSFPVLHPHPLAVGRYMGTFRLVVIKDPENFSFYLVLAPSNGNIMFFPKDFDNFLAIY